jgi:hypothetical protein
LFITDVAGKAKGETDVGFANSLSKQVIAIHASDAKIFQTAARLCRPM